MQNAAETYSNRAAGKSSLRFQNRFVHVAICTVYFLSIWRSLKRHSLSWGEICFVLCEKNSLIITLTQIKLSVLIFLKQSVLCKILQFISLPFEFFNRWFRWGKAMSDLSAAVLIYLFRFFLAVRKAIPGELMIDQLNQLGLKWVSVVMWFAVWRITALFAHEPQLDVMTCYRIVCFQPHSEPFVESLSPFSRY